MISYKRKGRRKKDEIIVILNLTPVERIGWTLKTAGKRSYNVIFNSDAETYWGGGRFVGQEVSVTTVDKKSKYCEIKLDLPALSALILK